MINVSIIKFLKTASYFLKSQIVITVLKHLRKPST